MNLAEQLEAAKAEVVRLEQTVKSASCTEAGHNWKLMGGRSGGCSDQCSCSVPIYECARCGDCDYGENEEAATVLKACRERASEEKNQTFHR